MMISTKGRYALRVMIELAMDENNSFTPLKEIAEHQEISEKYLEIIMKSLVKENLVIGLRGKGGGYKLAKPLAEYSVGSILKASEGSLLPVACSGLEGTACPREGKCATLPIWKGLDRVVGEYLEGISLEQLVEQAREIDGKL